MRQLWTMTASDLRQRVRDRSVIIFALIVPIALMFVFNVTLGGADDVTLDPITVAASVPPDDDLARTLVTALGQVDGMSITVDEVSADQAHELVRSGGAQLAVVVPAGFGGAVRAGTAAVVDVTEGDGSGIETDVALSVMQGVLDHLFAGAVVSRAGVQADVPSAVIPTLAQRSSTLAPEISVTQGRAATEQLSTAGAVVAGQAGLFLLFTVGFGVLGLVDEREQGTMARLRSMPMRPGLIVAAKGLVSYILGVVATTVLLIVGSMFFDVSFGSPVVVAVLVLCAVAAATSLMFIIARVARTAEQANIAQSILALVLGMAGGAFFPISTTGLAGHLLDLNPISAFTRGLGITAGGGGLTDIGLPVAIMLGFAVVLLALSRLVPDRGREL